VFCGVYIDVQTKKPNDSGSGSVLMGCLLCICFFLVLGIGLLSQMGIASGELILWVGVPAALFLFASLLFDRIKHGRRDGPGWKGFSDGGGCGSSCGGGGCGGGD